MMTVYKCLEFAPGDTLMGVLDWSLYPSGFAQIYRMQVFILLLFLIVLIYMKERSQTGL